VYRSSLDRLICFVVGADGHLYDKFWDGSQWVWEDQGPIPGGGGSGALSAVYREFSRGKRGGPSTGLKRLKPVIIDQPICFVTGGDGHLHDNFLENLIHYEQWVWDDQGPLPSGAAGGASLWGLSAVYQSSLDRLICFVTGSDGHLYDKFWDGSQWVWEDQGPLPSGANPFGLSAVYQSSLDRLVCFVTGADGHLYDKFWDGSQWVWEDQGSIPGGLNFPVNPSAVYRSSSDQLVCFVVGADGHLYDKFWDGSQWVWQDQGIPPSGSKLYGGLSAVYRFSVHNVIDQLVCFVAAGANDGQLYDKFWDGGQWVWENQGAPS
jgi:hypothetical protein